MYRKYKDTTDKFVFTTDDPQLPIIDVIFSNIRESSPDDSEFVCTTEYESSVIEEMVKNDLQLQRHIKDKLEQILNAVLQYVVDNPDNFYK